jgi:hypothetical protein
MNRTGKVRTANLTGYREDRPSCDHPPHEGLLRSIVYEIQESAVSHRRQLSLPDAE